MQAATRATPVVTLSWDDDGYRRDFMQASHREISAVIAVDPISLRALRASFFAFAPEPPCRADRRRHEATTVSRGPVAAAGVASTATGTGGWYALEPPAAPSRDRWAF